MTGGRRVIVAAEATVAEGGRVLRRHEEIYQVFLMVSFTAAKSKIKGDWQISCQKLAFSTSSFHQPEAREMLDLKLVDRMGVTLVREEEGGSVVVTV